MREKRQSNDLSQSNDVKRNFLNIFSCLLNFHFIQRKKKMIFFDKLLNMNIQHYIVKYIKLHKKRLGKFFFSKLILILFLIF
jgi:hypothetical protein